MKTLLGYLGKSSNKFRLAIISIFASVILGIIPYFIIYKIIDSLLENGQTVSLIFYLIMALTMGIVLFFKSTLYVQGLKYSHESAFYALMQMRKALAAKILKMPLGNIQQKGVGAYKKLFVDDIDTIEGVLAHGIPEGIPYVLQTLIVLICLFVLDFRIGFLVIATIIIGMIPMVFMVSKTKKQREDFYKTEQFMNKSIIEYVEGMEVIKAFNRGSSSYKKYETAIKDYKNNTLALYKASWKYSSLMYALLPTTILLALPFGFHFVVNQSMTLSVFILCLMLCLSISSALTKITEFLDAISITSDRIKEFDKAINADELIIKEQGKYPDSYDVRFSDVTFGYNEETVLKDINFLAKANEVTAIVGNSGGGKSTIAKLLVRFWNINSGSISIGNTDINDISQEDLMNLVSYVSQDTFLFDVLIMENIRLGNPEATDDQVINAAKASGCHDFISGLRYGYQTTSGSFGDKLSGGEKQRITIARAILKDSPVIILDEATSSTDPESEDEIQEAINALIKNKTLIVIAHRLSTIAGASQIIVVDNGSIADTGTHEKLLKNSEIYKRLWNAHEYSFDWNNKIKESAQC